MSKVMKKEIVESKKNNYTLILIIFFVFVIGIGVGYIVAKKDILKTIKDNSIEEKVEKDKKTKEQDDKVKNDTVKEDEEKTQDDVEVEEETNESKNENIILKQNINSIVSQCNKQGKENCETSFELSNGNEVHQFNFRKEGNRQTLVVNDKSLFNKYDTNITNVGLLDNGMVIIEYFNDEDQARLKTRDYYTNDLKAIKSINGISYNNDILSMEYEFVEVGDICINNEYKELKYYKAIINEDSFKIETKYIRTEKEYNCAGMV